MHFNALFHCHKSTSEFILIKRSFKFAQALSLEEKEVINIIYATLIVIRLFIENRVMAGKVMRKIL